LKILVVGSGKGLYFLCRRFLSKGHTVTVIDALQQECVLLARRLKVTVVHGDGTMPRFLEEAGAHEADVVLAFTPRDVDNLAVCQLARLEFQVPRCLAIVNDPDNEEVFEKLGVSAFSTTRIIAGLVGQRAMLDEVAQFIPVAEGKASVTEIRLPEDSPALGRTLAELALPAQSLIAVVLRDDEAIVPSGRTKLEHGDRIVLVTASGSHGPALKAILGKSA